MFLLIHFNPVIVTVRQTNSVSWTFGYQIADIDYFAKDPYFERILKLLTSSYSYFVQVQWTG